MHKEDAMRGQKVIGTYSYPVYEDLTDVLSDFTPDRITEIINSEVRFRENYKCRVKANQVQTQTTATTPIPTPEDGKREKDFAGIIAEPIIYGHAIDLDITCIACFKHYRLKLSLHNYNLWRRGLKVQNAFPTLNSNGRELLISHICGSCFDSITAEEDKK